MDYTQWTWEQLKLGVGKQNYVLSLIWGTLSKAKRMCHPKCIFTLQSVAARLHDQVTTSKEIEGLLKSSFLLVAILRSTAVTLDNFNSWSWEINPSSHHWMYAKWRRQFTSSFAPLLFIPFSSLLISGAGNRSGDVTELSNSQLKRLQFTSTFDANDLPYGTLAAVKHPVSDTPAISSAFRRVTSIWLAVWTRPRRRRRAHTHNSDHSDQGVWQGVETWASRVLRGWPGKILSPTLCVCVLNFLAMVRDSGLRTITDMTHGSHVTTQGHYIQNAGLMIARTVEGERIAV